MNTAMTAGGYLRFCGPRALAVAIGGGRLRSARALLAVQRMRSRPTAPSTALDDMVLLAMRAGLKVERFAVRRYGAGLRESADELGRRLLQEFSRDRRTPPDRPPEDRFQLAWVELAPTLPDRGCGFIREQRAKATRARLTSDEFLALHPTGFFWLLQDRVLIGDRFLWHVECAKDGRFLDEHAARRYGCVPLVDAYRLYPRETTQ